MRLKDRFDYAWEIVLKHKAHYFGGFAFLIAFTILSITLKSHTMAVMTILLYLTYSICLDICVLVDEGILGDIAYIDTMSTASETSEEPQEEESELEEDEDYDGYDSCEDCCSCEEECQHCVDQADEQDTEEDYDESDEYIGGR